MNKTDRRETYHEIHDTIKNHRKHLALRYDGLGGSDYVPAVGYLLSDNIIKEEELSELSDVAKELVMRFGRIKERYNLYTQIQMKFADFNFV